MIKNKPLILVVNDDGIESQGISFLSSVIREIGDVFVVAPHLNRSGASHSMTLNQPIYLEKINERKNEFICSGTPVDCVKIAMKKILPRKPDLCISGINHGSNHSINGLYSGTLHGAMEATIHGVSSLAFSHLSYSDTINFQPFGSIIKKMTHSVLEHHLPQGVTLNVNFPNINFNQIKGLKICQQGKGCWSEEFKYVKKNKSKTFYSISGEFKSDFNDKKSDSWALKNNFISIVPVTIDSTSCLTQELNYLEYEF